MQHNAWQAVYGGTHEHLVRSDRHWPTSTQTPKTHPPVKDLPYAHISINTSSHADRIVLPVHLQALQCCPAYLLKLAESAHILL